MKKVVSFLAAVMLSAVSAAGEAAGWMERFDDFKEYPYSAWPGDGTKTLPAPWEDTVSMYAHDGIGYGGSPGAGGPTGGWSKGHSFRPTGDTFRAGAALVARIFLPGATNWEKIRLAFVTEKTADDSGRLMGGATAMVRIGGSPNKDVALVEFWVSGSSKNQENEVKVAPQPFLPSGQWYEVRLTLREQRQVTAEYKHVEMSYWMPIGTLNLHSDFQPNYVAISTCRGARIDDVGYVLPAATARAPTAP